MNLGFPASVAMLIITMPHKCKEERVQLKEAEVPPRILSLPPSQPYSTQKANSLPPQVTQKDWQMNADSVNWAWAPARVLGPSDHTKVALLLLCPLDEQGAWRQDVPY